MDPNPLSEEEIKILRLLASRYVSFLDGKSRWLDLNHCMICYKNLTIPLDRRPPSSRSYLVYSINSSLVVSHARVHLKEHNLIAFI